MIEDYEITSTKIANHKIQKIIDKDGLEWYPLYRFIRIMLKESKKNAKTLGNDEKLLPFIKWVPSDYDGRTGRFGEGVKVINVDGIQLLLKKRLKKVKENGELTEGLLNYYKEILQYFNVKQAKLLDSKFFDSLPDLNRYSYWAYFCISNDNDIRKNTLWRKCNSCGKFYPYREKYFGAQTKIEKTTCLVCQGRDFKCDNVYIQFLYENGGNSLLSALRSEDNEDIANELKFFLNKGLFVGKVNEIKKKISI